MKKSEFLECLGRAAYFYYNSGVGFGPIPSEKESKARNFLTKAGIRNPRDYSVVVVMRLGLRIVNNQLDIFALSEIERAWEDYLEHCPSEEQFIARKAMLPESSKV